METRVITQELVFVIRLAQASGPPETAVDADEELKLASARTRLVHILRKKDGAHLRVERLQEKRSTLATTLAQITGQLTEVQQQLEKLQGKQKTSPRCATSSKRNWDKANPS